MLWAQAPYAEQANNSRIPAPKLEIGAEVWLLRRHVKTSSSSSKLDYKCLRKFRIIQKVCSHAYTLAKKIAWIVTSLGLQQHIATLCLIGALQELRSLISYFPTLLHFERQPQLTSSLCYQT